jgi:hypothetical protein
MCTAAQPRLEPGRAYRTQDLRRWSANPTRLARRLVGEGKLRQAAHGLYYAPITTRFDPAPPPSDALLRAFLNGEPFLVTGPPRWNALGLDATSMFAVTLVYNTQRSGEFRLGSRRFLHEGLVDTTALALAEDMRTERGIAALPRADNPSLVLDDPGKRVSVERASAKLAPMFWGPRIPLDEACATIRAWASSLRG